MRQVRTRVTMHPETITNAETIIKDIRRSKRIPKEPEPEVKRRYKKRPPWLNGMVWNTALRLANGNYRRLNVLSDTEIRVENHE